MSSSNTPGPDEWSTAATSGSQRLSMSNQGGFASMASSSGNGDHDPTKKPKKTRKNNKNNDENIDKKKHQEEDLLGMGAQFASRGHRNPIHQQVKAPYTFLSIIVKLKVFVSLLKVWPALLYWLAIRPYLSPCFRTYAFLTFHVSPGATPDTALVLPRSVVKPGCEREGPLVTALRTKPGSREIIGRCWALPAGSDFAANTKQATTKL
ncbi:hypothetical protein NUW58_g5053 [Xylaria curta]|uniref:Uncharacterized protein n=1 Tax=Xylaria curta TaxID=42375 RepID=A0ACC1P528_9PEZI|nr:hypothetical protein NUW58_g5053 [Xylaria curta]